MPKRVERAKVSLWPKGVKEEFCMYTRRKLAVEPSEREEMLTSTV